MTSLKLEVMLLSSFVISRFDFIKLNFSGPMQVIYQKYLEAVLHIFGNTKLFPVSKICHHKYLRYFSPDAAFFGGTLYTNYLYPMLFYGSP